MSAQSQLASQHFDIPTGYNELLEPGKSHNNMEGREEREGGGRGREKERMGQRKRERKREREGEKKKEKEKKRRVWG